jgi:DNA-binding NtrC family response regulator/tetratricopeptide (TPR) repeat protein
MAEFELALRRANDRFRRILECPGFYQEASSFSEHVAVCESILDDSGLSKKERANIELGLLRVKRMRMNVDSIKFREALSRIENSIADDFLLRCKCKLLYAELLFFVDGNALDAKCEYAVLEKQLRDTEQHYLYGLVTNGLGLALMWLGDDSKAEEFFQTSIGIFRRLGNTMQYAYGLNNYSVLQKKICHFSESERLAQKSLAMFQALGMPEGQILCYNNLGVVKFRTGDWGYAEYCYSRAMQLKQKLNEGLQRDAIAQFQDRLPFTEINLQHVFLRRREFEVARKGLDDLLELTRSMRHAKHRALILEFIGELKTEMMEYEDARRYLSEATDITIRTAPESDVMTEIARRQAQLELLRGDLHASKRAALRCVKLCRNIGDKHEMGAALRILGEVYAQEGLFQKATSALEASITTLRGINECYELMRSSIAYGEFLIRSRNADAEIYLMEAKQLCKKLEIDYYMAKIMLLSSKYAHNNEDYMAARAYLRKAEEITEGLHPCDCKKLKPQIRSFYKTVERSILQASMESAQKLKSIGKIYEEARFPIEELKPELAVEVARNVGADQLFLIRKKNKGFRVPLKYNISANDAKQFMRFQLRTNEKLFQTKDPTVVPLPTGKTLVCVPGQSDAGYLLCTLIDRDRSFSPRELEFLFASVEAMERVAEEYSEVPPYLDLDDFMEGDVGRLRHPGGHFQDIMTLDSEMIKVIHLAERASDANVPILLEGETGVGKELFAQAIHSQSPRKNKQFIAMNAGGVPLNLLESQLFGHIKGAFTDAVTDRHGLIEEARGGTIFFDEVGEMAEELQIKLLRLLENGEYRRLGENALRIADVRVVSATNKDLELRVKEGLFREDLYYRVATVKFRVPPLRNRKRDIEFLVRHFINEGLIKIGKPRRRINVDVKTLEAFELYDWPGNVRELKNEILRILSLIGEGDLIRFGMLSDHIKVAFRSKREDGGILAKRVDRYERRLILKALEDNEWNKIKTAEQIGIPRTTLLFKMKRLNIMS